MVYRATDCEYIGHGFDPHEANPLTCLVFNTIEGILWGLVLTKYICGLSLKKRYGLCTKLVDFSSTLPQTQTTHYLDPVSFW